MGKAEDLLKRLPTMDITQLRREWFQLYRTRPGASMTVKVMRLAIAYKIQELETGASARCAALRQTAAVARKKKPEDDGYGYAQHMKPGTRTLREYDGQIHEVLPVANGRFVYAGQVYRSLSEVGRKIRGVPTSGTNTSDCWRNGAGAARVADPPVVRCAIYTRKSAEECLKMSYKSLAAQRDAYAFLFMDHPTGKQQ